jgi:hypothetical protein
MPKERKNKTSKSSKRQLQGLPVMRQNVAGIDLGSARHWVCAPTVDGSGREIADFGATTPELVCMAEWLKDRKVESVAMESTGSIGLLPTKCWKHRVWKCCWWIRGKWRKYRGATRRPIRRTASGFKACIVSDCCGGHSDPLAHLHAADAGAR